MKIELRTVLKDENKLPDSSNPLLYDFSERSASAEFYFKQFKVEDVQKYKNDKSPSTIPSEMDPIIDLFKTKLSSDAIIVELGGSWHQNRSGDPYKFFPNYFPLDISYTSMFNYTKLFEREAVVSNAETLPFRDNCLDAVFTHTFLEHPIHPEKVLTEVTRVLRPGGMVVHCDAWHCRWWQRYGIIGVKKFNSLSFKEKIIFIAAKFTEIKSIRFPLIVTKRLFTEMFGSKRGPIDLKYKKLDPNYELHLYADEDAASTLDPLDVIRFYESRGFTLLNELTFAQRIFYRKMDIRMIKNL